MALTEKYNSESDLSLDPDSLLLTNRVVKPEDIHKMHCYVDAIDEVCSAVIVYPGTEFIFYPRDRTRNFFVDSADFDGSNGVGAVPLLPGRDSLLFDDFMKRLKEYR